MPVVRLGMSFTVDYAHSIPGHPRCSVKHGHTARVTVVVEGRTPLRGESYEQHMLIDFYELRRAVEQVLSKIDHRDLNELFEYPTAEALATWLYREIAGMLPSSVRLHSVKVQEGGEGWVEYTGEEQ